ncbi:MAG TPA: ROK family protein [Tepiditoga sp.]|nr:ROK family protein [Tepiditoga sp.]
MNPIKDRVIVFDVGGTKTTYGTVENAVISNFKKVNSDIINKKGVDFFTEIIDNTEGGISGIIIGVPAVVDNNGKILSAPNLKSIERHNLKDLLKEKYSVPVFITRDVNLQLFGEYSTFYKDDYSNALGIFIGTGLGASVIINKKIFTGINGAAVEIGHVKYPAGNNIKCNCGKTDCIELYSSGMALDRYIKNYKEETGKDITKEFFFSCDDKDLDKYKKLFFDSLVFSVSTLVNLFDPGLVIIGGGVINADKFPFEKLVDLIKSDLRKPLPLENTDFRLSQLNYESNIIGGYYFFKSINL